MKRLLSLLSLLILGNLIFSPLAIEAQTSAEIDAAIAREIATDPLVKAVSKVLPSVVAVTTVTRDFTGSGSGIIISKNGFILTNKHVIFDPNGIVVVTLANGNQKQARVWYRDPVEDFAIIKVSGTYTNVATLGVSSNLKLGQRVAAIGNAEGNFKNAIALGTVYTFNRAVHATAGNLEENLQGLIETTIPIVPGYSGGPLISSAGTVVGLNVAADPKLNHAFSIPINKIKGVAQNYINSKL